MFQFTHPGKGATRATSRAYWRRRSFNSRTLGRVRRERKGITLLPLSFQFTHPGKGATRRADGLVVDIHVSIHAPWEGCDDVSKPSSAPTSSFNSRTLGRVRRGYSGIRHLQALFQFTHPGKGATQKESTDSRSLRVSIHAPWEGCDPLWCRCPSWSWSFNSRTLGRVRPTMMRFFPSSERFQFTHPGKGATEPHPQRIRSHVWFQFTHPGKGATRQKKDRRRIKVVSIHAPWEGCDRNTLEFENTNLQFQFTHPGKGATVHRWAVRTIREVSIHAPWEGCD